MKWVGKICFLLIVLVPILSCNPPAKLQGIYKLKSDWPGAVVLYLNDDNSFVEFVGGDLCSNTNYFGYYTIKKRRLSLDPVSHNLNYLGKKDTIIYKYDPRYKGKEIYIYRNETDAYENAEVYTNDNRYLGSTNKQGFIKLPPSYEIDSLVIKQFVGSSRSFYINRKAFTQLFVLLYDYSMAPCSDLYYAGQFIITNKGLEIIKKDKKNKEKFYLKRIEM